MVHPLRGRLRPVLLSLLMTVLVSCSAPKPQFRATDITGVTWGKDFTLTDQAGRPFDTASLRGKVVVIYFGYTHCTDVCTPTMMELAQLEHRLGAEAARVQVVFVTVDPRHDTPARLKRYLAQFDPEFIGLTGSNAQIGAVAREYKIAWSDQPAAGGQERIAHTDVIYVKGPHGRMRLLINQGAPLPDIEHDIRLLLKESA